MGKKNNIILKRNLLLEAQLNKFAIAQININSFGFLKTNLFIANQTNTPIVLGFTKKSVEYFCGFDAIANLVKNCINFLEINIPIIIHYDNGDYEDCLKAMKAGFTSVMFSQNSMLFVEFYKKSREIIKKSSNDCLVEINFNGESTIDFNDDQKINFIEKVLRIAALKPGAIALGRISKNNLEIDFDLLQKIYSIVDIPLTLPTDLVLNSELTKKVINLGITKINITDESVTYYNDLREKSTQIPNFNVNEITINEVENIIAYKKFKLFGSLGKATEVKE